MHCRHANKQSPTHPSLLEEDRNSYYTLYESTRQGVKKLYCICTGCQKSPNPWCKNRRIQQEMVENFAPLFSALENVLIWSEQSSHDFPALLSPLSSSLPWVILDKQGVSSCYSVAFVVAIVVVVVVILLSPQLFSLARYFFACGNFFPCNFLDCCFSLSLSLSPPFSPHNVSISPYFMPT